MAKSRADIQKAYRERKKAKNKEEYLKKERERRHKNYVPTDKLSRRDRIRRNLKINEALKRHRKRKKEARLAVEAAERENNAREGDSLDTSGYESQGSQGEPQAPLIVQMPFGNRRNGPRKRMNRALAKKTKELSKIKGEFHELKKKHRTTMRKLQRLRKKLVLKSPSTPRSKTEVQIREAGLSKEQSRKIKKQLLMGNVIAEEVKIAKEMNKRTKSDVLRNVIAGRIVKKYRCASLISKSTGFSRNKIGKVTSKSIEFKRQERFREVRRFRDDVIHFMERDDNSRNLLGNADKIKSGGVRESMQKRVLTDYLSNLHAKFLGENPLVKLSLASFQRIRPKHILTTSFITRDSCLCTKHQDMALVLKALRREGVDVPANPEKFIESPSLENISEKIDKDMNYEEWKRVAVEEKGKKKMVMKIVKTTKSKEEFMKHLQDQTEKFKQHVLRMRTQYEQIRLLKQKLPVHQAVIHMDFTENYACKTAEEIQSAYWNQTSVTLHPTVVYTKLSVDQPLNHQSFVLISDELSHNAATLLTFTEVIIKEIKSIDPNCELVHFWTDSPTSQYRNKTIFHYVANHESITGIKARWNYFEAGHGKGPCDGLGGVTKRMADEAMKTGKVVIQDAQDFYAWTQSESCTIKNVKFRFVKRESCENTGKDLERSSAKPIKGTMKIHAVAEMGSDYIAVRNVSCYCDTCIKGDLCDLWNKEKTTSDKSVIQPRPRDTDSAPRMDLSENSGKQTRPANDNSATTSGMSLSEKVNINKSSEVFEVGQFVVALYDENWYVGKITDSDPDDESGYMYEVSFMEKKKNMFQWPSKEDAIWCRKEDILLKISAPLPSGKTMRMYKVCAEDMEKISLLT